MHRTYTYKVMPNKKVERKFYEWCGVCRYVYNVAKETKEESYKKGLSLGNYDLQKQLTSAKKENRWLYNIHNKTLKLVLTRLDNAYIKFYTDLKNNKKTNKPKWALKNKWNSIPFDCIKIKNDNFKLPKFGEIKVFKFKKPKGELKNANLVREADGLYLKIVVDEQNIERERDSQSIVAIDMGIKYFLTTSDGVFVDNPMHLFKKIKTLRIEQRKLSRMKKGGCNWKKQVNVISRIHQKVKRCRLDFLHKQSRILSDYYDYIICENLNIKGMSKNTKLSKHILDCSWGAFFNILKYKSSLIKVDPKFSSQECSKCGHICKENRVSQSLFSCVRCEYTENADKQACYNLLSRGRSALGVNATY